jgi:hypothetical protein
MEEIYKIITENVIKNNNYHLMIRMPTINKINYFNYLFSKFLYENYQNSYIAKYNKVMFNNGSVIFLFTDYLNLRGYKVDEIIYDDYFLGKIEDIDELSLTGYRPNIIHQQRNLSIIIRKYIKI